MRLVLYLLSALTLFAQTETHNGVNYNVAPYTRGAIANFTYHDPEASPLPAKGSGRTSLSFFTTVYRGTDVADAPAGTADMMPMYSTFPTPNSDGTMYFIKAEGNAIPVIYRASNSTVFRTVTDYSLNEYADPRWDTSGSYPYRIYFHSGYGGGCKLYRYDMSTDGTTAARTLVRDFAADYPACIGMEMGATGSPSNDSRYWGFLLRSTSANCSSSSTDMINVVTYDMQTNTIIGVLDRTRYLALGGAAANWDNCTGAAKYSGDTKNRPDSVDISPLGTKVFLNWSAMNNSPGSFGDGGWVVNKNFSGGAIKVTSHDAHYGWAFDANGGEVLVHQHNGSMPMASVGVYDALVAININDGTVYKLVDQGDFGYGTTHTARVANSAIKGWAIFSTYPASTNTTGITNPLSHYIMAVQVKDWANNPKIWRISDTLGVYPGTANSYFHEPHANYSFTGNRIWWGTDWITGISGSPGAYSVTATNHMEGVYVDLPADWNCWLASNSACSAGGGSTSVGVPTGLAATAISSSAINLSWTASTGSVAGYKIYRGGTQIGTSAAASYPDSGLAAATAYSYTVAAYDSAGNTSAQSAPVSATTLPAASPAAVSVTPAAASLGPSQTAQFQATVMNAANTAVTWSLSPAVGTISSAGLYTAPSAINATQTVTVKATCVASSTTAASATVTLSASSLPSIRVNTGGPAYTDGAGNVWSADFGYSGGSTFATANAVANTSTPQLYRTERYQPGGFSYTFNVSPGVYTVKLKFAEIWFTSTGQRVFNVSINGQQVLTRLDIVAAAGGPNIAIDYPIPVNVSGSQIVIQFAAVVENPKISAIEITPAAAPAPVAVRVNSGGGAYTDPSGIKWSADTGYSGGYTYATSTYIANTNSPVIYQSERYQPGGFSYTFNVSPGVYTVKLKFAEIWFTSTGKRVFNVSINGSQVLTNFDVVAAAGGAFTAIDKPFTVNVTNGSIAINFNAVVENPKVSAIEILSQ